MEGGGKDEEREENGDDGNPRVNLDESSLPSLSHGLLARLVRNERLEVASVTDVDQASAAKSLVSFVDQADGFLFVFGHCELHDGVGLVHVAVLEVSQCPMSPPLQLIHSGKHPVERGCKESSHQWRPRSNPEKLGQAGLDT